MAIRQQLTSFNYYPKQTCLLARPERYHELSTTTQPTIARGQGRSYGDAALNENAQVLLTERLNRFLAFEHKTGQLTAEAGVTLTEILALIVPYGWFLPVTPGSQQISLGGCIAADVHGKNHHHVGSFGNYILWLELITADGRALRCSRSENADLFAATIGGMGLTGIIGAACIQLTPVESSYMHVTYTAAKNLSDAIALLLNPKIDDAYSVAWIDTLASGDKFGRTIIMAAHHATLAELNTQQAEHPLAVFSSHFLPVPFSCPSWLLNQKTQFLFNEFYYRRHTKKTEPFISTYQQYFYPLDSLQNWGRLYGKRGFVQYQCVLPLQTSEAGLQQLLAHLQKTAYPAFLAVLKRFGEKPNPGLLSFPLSGFTLALDIPIKNIGLFRVLDELDAIVMQHGGRIYLAKDARLNPQAFRTMYPNYDQWLSIKQKIDPNNLFSSSLARRLEIGNYTL